MTKSILLDGPSRVGKTSVAEHVVERLSPEVGKVCFVIAGDVFRRMTVMCLEEVGPSPDSTALAEQVSKIAINADVLLDDDREWGDLQRPEVTELVSVVGSLPEAQTIGQEWYDMVGHHAQSTGADLLVMDGRNPRDRLERVFRAGVNCLALDLFLDCEVQASVRRNPAFTSEQWPAEIEKLAQRRQLDATRPILPMRSVRHDAVMFETGGDDRYMRAVVGSSLCSTDAPAPVYFDNSRVLLPDMLHASEMLARTALEMV